MCKRKRANKKASLTKIIHLKTNNEWLLFVRNLCIHLPSLRHIFKLRGCQPLRATMILPRCFVTLPQNLGSLQGPIIASAEHELRMRRRHVWHATKSFTNGGTYRISIAFAGAGVLSIKIKSTNWSDVWKPWSAVLQTHPSAILKPWLISIFCFFQKKGGTGYRVLMYNVHHHAHLSRKPQISSTSSSSSFSQQLWRRSRHVFLDCWWHFRHGVILRIKTSYAATHTIDVAVLCFPWRHWHLLRGTGKRNIDDQSTLRIQWYFYILP